MGCRCASLVTKAGASDGRGRVFPVFSRDGQWQLMFDRRMVPVWQTFTVYYIKFSAQLF